MTTEQVPVLDRILRVCLHLWIFSLIFSVVAAEGLAIVLFLLWLPTLRSRPRLWFALDLPVLVFLVLRLLSVATSVDPSTSVHALRKIPFLLVFFPVSRMAWRSGARGVFPLLRTLTLAGLAAGTYGLIRLSLSGVYPIHSTTSGPSTLSIFLAAAMVVGVALAVGGLLRPLLPWLFAFAGMLWAMAFTYSRAAWFAAVVVGLALVSRWRRWVTALVIMAAIILLVVPGFRMRRAGVLQWPPNFGDRQVIWQSGWQLVEERPLLGHGPGTFRLLFDRWDEVRDKDAGAWRNFILQLLVESGIAGLLAFAWVVLEAIELARRGRRDEHDPTCRPVATALLAGINALLFAGLFGNLVGDPVIDQLFWGLVALLAVFARPAALRVDRPAVSDAMTAPAEL